jgi:cyclic beta-1,2-glucan synthetase
MVKILQVKNSILDKQNLEKYLEQFAADNILITCPDKNTFPLERLIENKKYIELVCKLLEEHIKLKIPIHSAGEWLLDNYYLIEKSVKTIEKNLTLNKYVRLPAIAEDGFARVYAIANEIISNTDGKINENNLIDYLEAYQNQKKLYMQEIWDIGLFLQICIIEKIRNISEKIFITQMQRYKAQNMVNRFIERKREKKFNIDVNSRYSFIEFLSYKLRQYGRISIPYIDALDKEIRKAGMTLDDVISREHFDIALKTLSMKNCIMSLKTIERINNVNIFERVSAVEKILKEDPADVYTKMDYSTKEYYRNIVLEISKKTKNSEIYVAQKAVELCKRYQNLHDVNNPQIDEKKWKLDGVKYGKDSISNEYKSQFDETKNDVDGKDKCKLDGVKGETECEKSVQKEINAKAKEYDEQDKLIYLKKIHVGYYLVDNGKKELLSYLTNKKVYEMNYEERAKLYVYLNCLFSFLITATFSIWLKWIALFLFIPVKNIVSKIFQYNMCKVKKTKILPKMDYQNNIPDSARTMCIIPTMLKNSADVDEMMSKMEEYYIANKSENLFFTLLGDCTKSDTQETREDKEIANEGIYLVNELNKKYGNKFFFVYRKREWNASEKCFMGWERKRGLINQFNDFLLGKQVNFKVNTCEEFVDKNLKNTCRGFVDKSLKNTCQEFIDAKLENTRENFVNENTRNDCENFNVDKTKKQRFIDVKYVITLDSDTTLTLDSAFRLIGTIDHILNRPVVNKIKNIVVDGHGIIQPRIGIDIESGNKSLFSRIFSGDIGTSIYANAISDFYQDNFDEGTFTGKGIYDLDVFDKVLRNSIPENKILSHDLIEGSYLRCGLASDILLMDETPSNYISYKIRKERWSRGDTQELPWINSQISFISKYKIKDNIYRNFNGVFIFISYLILLMQSSKYVFVPLLLLFFPALIEIIDFFILEPKNRLKVKTFYKNYSRIDISFWQCFIEFITLPDDVFLQICAFTKAMYRMNFSHNFLLEWTTAREAENLKDKNAKYYFKNMNFQIYVAIILIGIVSSYLTYSPFYKLLIISFEILWLLAPEIMYNISKESKKVILDEKFSSEEKIIKEYRRKDEYGGHRENREYLIDIAKKTWLYFKENQVNYLPADNFQEDRKEKIAMRTSPTNIGFSLMSAIASYDLHFENLEDTIEFINNEIDSVDMLKKWNGHLYNWYDLKTMQPLPPFDISSVDSGNFVGYLFTVKAFLRDCLDETNSTRRVMCDHAMNESNSAGKIKSDYAGNEINAIKRIGTDDVKLDVNYISKILNLIDKITRLIADTDFSKLYNKEIGLFSIGYSVSEGKLYDSYYDLLASEARQTSIVAIAKKDVPSKHWASLSRTLTSINQYRGLVSWGGTTFEYLMPNIIIPTYKGTIIDESCRLLVYSNMMYAKRLNVPWGISESAYSVKDLYGNYQYKTFGVPWLGLKRGLEDDIVISPYSTALSLQICFKEGLENLKRLQKEKLLGKYGFYDSIDYKPSKEVVKTFMAHHEGMILTSIDNALNKNIFQKRFMSNPEIVGIKVLLEEKMLEDEIVTKEKREKVQKIKYDGYKEEAPRTRGYNVISKNEISNIVKDDGYECTKFDDIVVGKGFKFFIKNISTNKIYDFEKMPKNIEFTPYSSKFNFEDGNIKCSINTTMAPDADVEIKKIQIKNNGINDLNLELTTFEDVILSNIRQYNSHPAFDKMFLRFNNINDKLLIKRKGRMPNEKCIFAAKTLFMPDGKFEYEIDKEKIIKRENIDENGNINLDEIIRNSPQFSSKIDNVINPVIAMRRHVKIKKGEKCDIFYITSAGIEKEDILKNIDMYMNTEKLDRVFELEKNQMKSQIRYMGLTEKDISKYQSMLNEIFRTNQEICDSNIENKSNKESVKFSMKTHLEKSESVKLPSKTNFSNGEFLTLPCKMNLANSQLWKFGVSGDFPIILFEISNKNNLYYLKEMLKAFQYFKTINVDIELVVISKLNIIDELINEKLGHYLNSRGGIFVIDNIGVSDRKMLEMRACKVIDVEKGDIL